MNLAPATNTMSELEAEQAYEVFGLSEKDRETARKLGERERSAKESAEREGIAHRVFIVDHAKKPKLLRIEWLWRRPFFGPNVTIRDRGFWLGWTSKGSAHK